MWLVAYREARDSTLQMIEAKCRNENRPFLAKLEQIMPFDFFRNALFASLVNQYRRDRDLSRRQLRDKLEEGSFWEDFLDFLSQIDWEKVIELIIKLIEAIISIIGVL